MKLSSFVSLMTVLVLNASPALAGEGGPTTLDFSQLKKEVHAIHGQILSLSAQVKGLKKENAVLKGQVAALQKQAADDQTAIDFTKKLMGVVQVTADTGPSGMDRVTFTGPLAFDYPNVIVRLSAAKNPPYVTTLSDWYLSSNWSIFSLGQDLAATQTKFDVVLQKQASDNAPAMAFLTKLMSYVQVLSADETVSGVPKIAITASMEVLGDLYTESFHTNVATIYKSLAVWTSYFETSPVYFADFFADFMAHLAGEDPTTTNGSATLSDVCEMVWCTGQPGICNTISIGSGQSLIDMVTAEAVYSCVDGVMTAPFAFVSPETDTCLNGMKIGSGAYAPSLLPMGSLTDKATGNLFLDCQ